MRPQYRDTLRKYELTESEWDSIDLVKDWLRIFCDATLAMSTSKRSTLSEVHAVFKGLQDHLVRALEKLPDNAPKRLRRGLINSHRKLSDYYTIFDKSPFYIWASSTCNHPCTDITDWHQLHTVLDPRIGYNAFLADCRNDPDLTLRVKDALDSLHQYYAQHYAPDPLAPRDATPEPTAGPQGSPCKFTFVDRYSQGRSQAEQDELKVFLRLLPKRWDTCNPVQWWASRAAQFPNLSCLARDLLSIPGKHSSTFWTSKALHSGFRFFCFCWENFFGGSGHNFITTC